MKQDSEQQNLKERLFERIEMDHVCPRSRWFFHSRECVVWSLWLLSVVIGAFAVAVSFFVVMHSQYAFYEVTHDNFLTFLVEVLPYLWIIAFGVMVLVAVYNLRHTKRGYRYSVMTIVGSSVIVSVGGGIGLHMLGLGYSLDRELGMWMPVYKSQVAQERELWQAPGEGRLIGRQVAVGATNTVMFEDVTGTEWELDVAAMNETDLAILATKNEVRVLGLLATTGAPYFSGCGAFPWMLHKPMPKEVLSKERERFLERVYELGHTPDDRLVLLKERAISNPNGCASLPAVRRMMQ